MKYDFALLRFAEDPNISDRGYWYLTDLPLQAGERVLAPVGVHDRLQCAVVERTLSAAEEDAPYDLRTVKRVEAKYGARKLVAGGTEALEFGGMRYDRKHFTRFGKVLWTPAPPEDLSEFAAYGVTKTAVRDVGELARANGGVLLTGEEGRRMFELLAEFCRGKKTESGGETAALLREKLL